MLMRIMEREQDFLVSSVQDLNTRGRLYLRAFLVNTALVLATGLVMVLFDVDDAVAAFLGGPQTAAAPYMTNGLVAWGLGGVVIFLVPAMAAYCARCGLSDAGNK